MTVLTQIELVKQSEPSTPVVGELTLYVGTDGVLYAKDSSGTIYKISN
jgi:hypothetical protein